MPSYEVVYGFNGSVYTKSSIDPMKREIKLIKINHLKFDETWLQS